MKDGSSSYVLDSGTRSDVLGWFDCSKKPSSGVSCYFSGGTGNNTSNDDGSGSGGNEYPALHRLVQKMETLTTELRGMKSSVLRDIEHTTTRSKVMITCYKGKCVI